MLRSALRGSALRAGALAGRPFFPPSAASFVAVPTARWSAAAAAAGPSFHYQDLWETDGPKDMPWRKITGDHVSVHEVMGKRVLKVEPEALRLIAQEGMKDIAHLLRPGHLQQLSNILKDPEASDNDRFVALELLKNANVAAGMVLPGCQDTGTAIIMGKKGQYVWTEGNDEEMLSRGVFDTYHQRNLRYSQVWLDDRPSPGADADAPCAADLVARPPVKRNALPRDVRVRDLPLNAAI